jgi:homocysteine S-methyltransferase
MRSQNTDLKIRIPVLSMLPPASDHMVPILPTDRNIRVHTAFHKERLDVLYKTNPDFFACETIPSFQEAKVLGELLKNYEIPAWVSFSCKDDVRINDDAQFSVALKLFDEHPTVFALGVNCTAPQHVSTLIKIIKSEAADKKVVVYPNSGEVFDPETKSWSGLNDTHLSAMMSNEWLGLGADIVGGCCRIGPKHIAAMNIMLKSRKAV